MILFIVILISLHKVGKCKGGKISQLKRGLHYFFSFHSFSLFSYCFPIVISLSLPQISLSFKATNPLAKNRPPNAIPDHHPTRNSKYMYICCKGVTTYTKYHWSILILNNFDWFMISMGYVTMIYFNRIYE